MPGPKAQVSFLILVTNEAYHMPGPKFVEVVSSTSGKAHNDHKVKASKGKVFKASEGKVFLLKVLIQEVLDFLLLAVRHAYPGGS
jgi:hypothetical protein